MKFSKIVAAVAAGAMAVSMMAVNAFATTVEIDTDYPGSWSSSGKGISKADLLAVGGDVKINLTIETRNLAGLADQFLVNPIDYDNGWKSQTDFITSDTAVAKTDGWICVQEGSTSVEFVLDATAIESFGDTGLCFTVQNVTVKSADYELAAAKQGAIPRVSDQEGKDYCFGKFDPRAGAAEETAAETEAAVEETEAPAEETEAAAEEVVEEVAEEEAAEEVAVEEVAETEAAVVETEAAPVADTTTAPAATGNTAASAIAVVMVAAAGAMVASKRK